MFSALGVTILVEAVVAYVWTKRNPLEVLFVVSSLEFITHPISIYAYHFQNMHLLLVEVLVVVAEAAVYVVVWQHWNRQQAASMFGLSVLANAASLVCGLLVFG